MDPVVESAPPRHDCRQGVHPERDAEPAGCVNRVRDRQEEEEVLDHLERARRRGRGRDRPHRREHRRAGVDRQKRRPPSHPDRPVGEHAPQEERSEPHHREDRRVMQRLEHRKPTGRREIELGGEQRGREEGELGRLFRLPPARRDLGNALQRCGLHAGQPMHRPAAPTTPGSVW